jgi:hypothetical protein
MTTPNEPAWIDDQGIVWSHDCRGKATPATAIPNERVAEIKGRLNWIIDNSYDDHAKGAARVALAELGE